MPLALGGLAVGEQLLALLKCRGAFEFIKFLGDFFRFTNLLGMFVSVDGRLECAACLGGLGLGDRVVVAHAAGEFIIARLQTRTGGLAQGFTELVDGFGALAFFDQVIDGGQHLFALVTRLLIFQLFRQLAQPAFFFAAQGQFMPFAQSLACMGEILLFNQRADALHSLGEVGAVSVLLPEDFAHAHS